MTNYVYVIANSKGIQSIFDTIGKARKWLKLIKKNELDNGRFRILNYTPDNIEFEAEDGEIDDIFIGKWVFE